MSDVQTYSLNNPWPEDLNIYIKPHQQQRKTQTTKPFFPQEARPTNINYEFHNKDFPNQRVPRRACPKCSSTRYHPWKTCQNAPISGEQNMDSYRQSQSYKANVAEAIIPKNDMAPRIIS